VTRVIVVNASPLLRAGLESVAEIAGTADTLEQAGLLAAELDPDLIVIDWDQDQALELIDFAAEAPPILVLTSDPQPPWMTEALRSGIRGILPRDASTAEVAAAIAAAAAGLVVLHPQSMDGSVTRPIPSRPAEPLSPREIEVLRLMAEGLSNKTIAWRLSISEHTVKFHVNSIFSKLGAGTRTEAVMVGVRQGLVLL
jgi:NarL family two-component system response regulator YdfI